MNVMVIGSGGREHALAWQLARSDSISRVFVAPGNGGTVVEPKCINLAIDVNNFSALSAFARRFQVALTVVGPEEPMANGIRDHFDETELACLAPTQMAAQLESSKSFAKHFMQRHDIPTAAYEEFTDLGAANEYLSQCSLPIVIKADGLAAGKGVVVCQTREEALATTEEMLEKNRFGDAGAKIVVEEFLTGEEASYIVLSDGENYRAFASSQDHKPVFNGNQGPNTGGMGAYSPAPIVDAEVEEKIQTQIIQPCIAGMASEGTPFQGFLYAGLMISPQKDPYVIEFNCRFGDPEAQVVLYRLESDFAELCQAALNKQLNEAELIFARNAALGVVLTSEGYPGSYNKGLPITGLDQTTANTKVFHAGTRRDNDSLVTDGGRVVCVVGSSKQLADARDLTYRRVSEIEWQGHHFRSDIGFQALQK